MNSRIMVVDDDDGFRTTLVEILMEEGRDVVSAEIGFQAVRMASGGNIALIFMDIQMPGMNGVEAFLKIKEILPGCVVAMMTGYAADSLAQQAIAEEAVTILKKPLSIENIFELIGKVMPEAISS